MSLGIITFNLNNVLIRDNISTIHKEITNKVLIKLDSYLSIPHTINNLNDSFLHINPDHINNLELLRKYLYKQLSIFETVNLIAFGSEEGDYVEAQRMEDGRIRTGNVNNGNLQLWTTEQTTQKLSIEKIVNNYDPRQRPWYKASKDKKIQTWSDIYLYSSNNQPAISGNQPYFSENSEFTGVLTTSVTLNGISEFLNRLVLSDNSSILLMDPEGFTIASSKNIPLLNSNNNRISAVNLDDPVFAASSREFLINPKTNGSGIVTEFAVEVDNIKYTVRSTPYYGPRQLKWYLMIIIPQSDFMFNYYRASVQGVVFLIIFLFLTVFFSYLIARHATKPIVILSDLVASISWKEDSVKNRIIPAAIFKRSDEIGILAKAFSDMEDRLNTAFSDLIRSQKEFKDLIENINSIIMRISPDGTIQYCNSFGLKFYGYLEEELIGKTVQETVLNTNDPEHIGILEKIFAKDEQFWNGTNKNVKSNGEEVWILWSNTLLFEDNGKASELLSIGQDYTSRKAVEIKLSTSLEEKNILLKEIHHRVKNNLQIVTSLINLQLNDISNKKVQSILKSLQGRIQSMSLVHEMLYSTKSLSEIDFYDYLFQIIGSISATYKRTENPIQVSISGDILYMDIERSTTCGLLVNEIIINAFRHAFEDQTDCKIDINITKNESDKIIIRIEDNGIGISTGNKSADKLGMGSLLIKALTDQLDGKMEISENNGTSFILSFQN